MKVNGSLKTVFWGKFINLKAVPTHLKTTEICAFIINNHYVITVLHVTMYL